MLLNERRFVISSTLINWST